MRKLIAVITTMVTALAILAVGLVSPASASLTSPANGAVLRGSVTMSETGGYDDSTLDHCGWFGGSGGSTRLQLINSSGTVLINQFWNTGGARSHTFDTRSYPNGTYTIRGIIEIRRNSGFLGLGCKTDTETSNRTVTIDNITAITVEAQASAPQNTSIPVSARLTDAHDSGPLSGRTVTFSVSGGGSVNGTTDSNGVASATLPVNGGPRNATVTASFAQTSFYKGSSAGSPLSITKNTAAITLAQPGAVVFGQPTSFSATVTAANGTSAPSGTVQFTVDGSDFGAPASVGAGGVATLANVASLAAGTHTIGAKYSGDANFFNVDASSKQQVVDKAPTSTVLTSTGSPTVSGQPVTFTATVAVVAPGAGSPAGGVQFNVDGQPFGTAVPLTGDTAALTIANLPAGNHQVSATYNGNASFASSTSAELTHGVNRADTTLQLSTSNPNAVAGEPLTFTADLSVVAPGAGTPTGDVQFFVDGDPLGGPVPLNGTSATSPTAHLDAGDHVITADYQGDARFAGASDSIDQDVEAAQTTTTVTSSPNPSVFGQQVTIRAEVAPVAPATGTPQGVARIIVDGSTVDFVDLTNGVAEYQTSDLAVGAHSFQARYVSEDPNFVTSLSSEASHQVNKAATKTTVTTSGSPSVFGQPVTFTASVSVQAPGAGDPSGTITFTDGSTVIDTQPVSSATGGQASITVSNLSVAQHAITAAYDGDDSFQGSNGSVTQKVNRAQTSTVVTSSANPSQSGQAITFTATISPVAPGAGDPTGTVRFTVNGAPLGGARTVVDGAATSPQFSSLAPGIYKIVATYSGDGNFVGSNGALDQGAGQNVTKGDTAITLESDDPTSAFTQPVTFTATVDALPPATRRPTGVVQFWEGGVLLGASSLTPGGQNQGTASFVSSTLAPGSHAVRAVYVGNFNFNGGTASTVQTVQGAPTVTGLESSKYPATYGDDVTFTAVVSEGVPAPGEPTGTVTFTEGGNVLGTASVATVGGRQEARVTVPGLGAGTHQVKAAYSGDATFAGSESSAFSQVVLRAGSGLEAQVIVREVGDNGGKVRATLTGNDGAPLAGQTLVFDTTQNTDHQTIHICTVVTDANGYAECDGTTEILASILDVGYDVHFAGNADYLPADDHQTYFYSGDD
ncbi:MAG TPA: Ig-like domain repeat protein [Nocardioides sp.]|nr:Ig-like domain repeat protein [Nocardioides sp.]